MIIENQAFSVLYYNFGAFLKYHLSNILFHFFMRENEVEFDFENPFRVWFGLLISARRRSFRAQRDMQTFCQKLWNNYRNNMLMILTHEHMADWLVNFILLIYLLYQYN